MESDLSYLFGQDLAELVPPGGKFPAARTAGPLPKRPQGGSRFVAS
jgi:hypothetical protein